MRRSLFVFLAALAASAQVPQPMPPRQPNIVPKQLEGVGIDQKLNQQLPLSLTFRDEAGRPVQLAQYFGRKPVMFALVYYECPMLCTEILNGMVGALKGVPFDAGKDYELVAISFDPKDKSEIASEKQRNYARRYGREGAARGFHFLTGDQAAINAITSAAGFRYKYDEKTGQFAHASAIFILTPDGRISRVFYGVDYAPRDLRLGLVEASQGKIGSAVDQLLLFCYHYDPSTGKYSTFVLNLVRLTGVVFMIVLTVSMFFLWRREARSRQRMLGTR